MGGWLREDVDLVSKDRGQRLWGKGLQSYSEPGMWGRVQLESLLSTQGLPGLPLLTN